VAWPRALRGRALAFKSGTYSGTTSQVDAVGDPKPLQLKVNKKKNKVTIGFFELEAPPCGPNLQFSGGKTAVRASGKFKWEHPSYGYVKGQVHHNEAEGTARYKFDPRGCDTGVVTWTAERSGQ
jgi:hypothetical protein